MEDFDFIERAQDRYPFRIIPKSITVSARKYENNSYLRVQIANFVAFNMYRLRYTPPQIAATYRRLLNYRYSSDEAGD